MVRVRTGLTGVSAKQRMRRGVTESEVVVTKDTPVDVHDSTRLLLPTNPELYTSIRVRNGVHGLEKLWVIFVHGTVLGPNAEMGAS